MMYGHLVAAMCFGSLFIVGCGAESRLDMEEGLAVERSAEEEALGETQQALVVPGPPDVVFTSFGRGDCGGPHYISSTSPGEVYQHSPASLWRVRGQNGTTPGELWADSIYGRATWDPVVSVPTTEAACTGARVYVSFAGQRITDGVWESVGSVLSAGAWNGSSCTLPRPRWTHSPTTDYMAVQANGYAKDHLGQFVSVKIELGTLLNCQ